jgi:hypothetical protein
MKNLFLTLAFMLIGSFAFANNSYFNSVDNQLKNEISKINNLELNNENLTVLTYETVILGEDLLECHVKIKGTINGQAVNIDVTFTSDSGSCIKDTVKLLKELAAEM